MSRYDGVGLSAFARRRVRALAITAVLSAIVFSLQACSSGAADTTPPVPAFVTIDPPGAVAVEIGTTAQAINTAGEIVVSYSDSNFVWNGYARTASGSFTTFSVPGAGTSMNQGTEAFDVNDKGTIVGTVIGSTLSTASQDGYIRAPNGTFTTFDVPSATSTLAETINNNGEVAGMFRTATGGGGFVRGTDGTLTTFDFPVTGGTGTPVPLAILINAAGTVSGTFQGSDVTLHGFLRATDGTLTVLDAPGAGTGVAAGTAVGGINDQGVIVGEISMHVTLGLVPGHSFVRTADGTYTTFDPPEAGNAGSGAQAINNNGVIVGSYFDTSSIGHGYIRNTDGTFVTFDDPDAAQVPFSISSLGTLPAGMNASGAIVGEFSDAAGARHGFVRE